MPEFLRHIESIDDGTSGVVNQIWFKGNTNLNCWIDALEAIDKTGNKEPLLDLLKSNQVLPPDARFYLADLIDRQVGRKRGGQNTPAYDRTDAEAMLEIADWFVRFAREEYGKGLSDAIEYGADQYRFIDKNARADFVERLTEFHSNRRTSSRRMKKRRPLTRS